MTPSSLLPRIVECLDLVDSSFVLKLIDKPEKPNAAYLYKLVSVLCTAVKAKYTSSVLEAEFVLTRPTARQHLLIDRLRNILKNRDKSHPLNLLPYTTKFEASRYIENLKVALNPLPA